MIAPILSYFIALSHLNKGLLHALHTPPHPTRTLPASATPRLSRPRTRPPGVRIVMPALARRAAALVAPAEVAQAARLEHAPRQPPAAGVDDTSRCASRGWASPPPPATQRPVPPRAPSSPYRLPQTYPHPAPRPSRDVRATPARSRGFREAAGSRAPAERDGGGGDSDGL